MKLSQLRTKMNFMTVLVLFSALAHSQIQRNVDISELNPVPERISGVVFPRLKEIKYRGATEVQYSRSSAILAMLGADEPLESILYSGIKLQLMKERCSFCATLAPQLVLKGFNNSIELELLKNDNKPYTVEQAREIAYKMMEADLSKKLADGTFIDEKVDYRSPRYEMFPQDVVFSTVYLEVANIYSRFITVIKESTKHSLDLNFWNKIRNGAWLFIARKWADRGEFITPIMIDAPNIIGFNEYLSQVPNYTVFRPLPAELDIAYMKLNEKGEDLVLIFDGKTGPASRATAIIQDGNSFELALSQFDPSSDIPKKLQSTGEKPQIIGVFKMCTKNLSCKLTTDAFKKYKRSRRILDEKLIKQITSYENNGMKPKLFYQETTIDAKDDVSLPSKTIYPSNIEIMNNLEKEQKFETFERIKEPTHQEDEQLQWSLEARKLKAQGAIYLDIPEKYRNKRIKNITLTQRQDYEDNTTSQYAKIDKSPAYTSIQFYTLTESTDDFWRYPAVHVQKLITPKFSLFAELRDEDQMRSVTIPFSGKTRGHETDVESTEVLSIGAVRLLGIGIDAATLYEFTIEFEK
jgi:hypothetical protein